MIYWIDAQLPPQLASWLNQTFKVEAYALRDQKSLDVLSFQEH
jgi:predicted nuclease of predicted toxin-antitoxin system